MAGEDTQNLAEKIADLLRNEGRSDEFQMLRESIEKINQRLETIENKLDSQNPKSPTRNPQLTHPSQQKFNVIEAIVNEVFEGLEQEKTCTFEPNGKPCDHCSMCNSRGF